MPTLYLRSNPARAIDAKPLGTAPVRGRSVDRRLRVPVALAARIDGECGRRNLDRATLIRVAIETLLNDLEEPC